MLTVPAPTHAQEEWPDADFDLPEGDVIRPPPDAESDKEDEEDWDMEMDLGKTGGAKAASIAKASAGWGGSISRRTGMSAMVTIRPPISTTAEPLSPDLEDDDEGISTIKVSALPTIRRKTPEIRAPIEEDMEVDLVLPSDLTQLSLRPLGLNHKFSKGSLEWGDRDHTSSSASSDAYSSLGFGVAASPSTSSTSASLPGTDDDCDNEEDGELDGLVIPTGLFETEQGRKHLTKILDMKKKTPKVEEQVKVATPDPEDDFEIGLVINGDNDLNPLKLAQNKQTKRLGTLSTRSNSAPARPSALRPPSRLKIARPKTPVGQSGSSSQSSSRSSLSPPNRPSISRRTHTFQALPSQSSQPSQPPSSFLAPKQGVRNQKSHSALKSPSPPNSASRKLSRKASLSSLLETSNAQIVPPPPASSSRQTQGYSAATAASRARLHTNSTSRMHSMDVQVPPTRPSTPSSNPAALRLTLPTSMSRMKSRPSINSIFPGPSTSGSSTGSSYATRSPPPSAFNRPPSRASPTLVGTTKILRRTKRRVFGDGTELDEIEDLPTDRDKEAQFRVQPKGIQNRVPGGSYSKLDKDTGRGTIRGRKDTSDASLLPVSAFSSLRHKQSRVDALSKAEPSHKKKPSISGHQRRKPTLIRNLGGTGAPKVVGEMRWNPQTLRWEGNDHVLRDFDAAIGTSSRPALITHLTGSSIGSPVGSFGAAARVVGNMVFDPVRMCWMSTLPPDEDEPDVFADMADDEEDGDWEGKGGTIRANQPLSRLNTTNSSTSDASTRLSDASRMQSPSPVESTHMRSNSESGSERGSRASIVFDVEDNFVDLCRDAESRHRAEMRGWTLGRNDSPFDFDSDHSFLYEIRALATRQY